MNPSTSIISAYCSIRADQDLDEGLSSIATSKLADLARGFILKGRPIIVMHKTESNSTITFKLKRGLINHVLSYQEEGKGEKTLSKAPSAAILLTRVLNEVRKLVMQGYIEV